MAHPLGEVRRELAFWDCPRENAKARLSSYAAASLIASETVLGASSRNMTARGGGKESMKAVVNINWRNCSKSLVIFEESNHLSKNLMTWYPKSLKLSTG